MCNTKFGLSGINCDEFCDHAIAVIILTVIESLLGLILFVVSTFLAVRLFLRVRHRRARSRSVSVATTATPATTRRKGRIAAFCEKWNPVALTLFFTTLGSLCFAVSPSLSAVVGVGFPRVFTVTVDPATGRQLRRSPQELEYANTVFFAISYNVTLCAFLLLPLAWVSFFAA